VNNYLEDPEKFPDNSHLIGDTAYTLHERLMTPYHDNGHLTNKQKNYNFCHASARIVIERAFELLKGRFSSLLAILDMERIDLIPEFIIACCVLHNICLLHKDDFPIAESNILENNDKQLRNSKSNDTGYTKRDMICNNLTVRNA